MIRTYFIKSIILLTLCAAVLLPTVGCNKWKDFDNDVKRNRENMEENDRKGADPDYNTKRGGGGTSDGSQ